MPNKFAIAAGNEKTATTAAEILRAGGNAVDAVLAAGFTAFMAEPIMAQPFGGGFLMVQFDKNSKAQLLDFYGHTPYKAPHKNELDNHIVEANFGETTQKFHIGAGTIAVPGIAAGFSTALERFGTMKLAELSAMAILYAREGIVLDKRQEDVFQVVAAVLEPNLEAMHLYGNAKGKLLKAGERWRNLDLSNLLEVWAQEGVRFMTEGEAARALLVHTNKRGAVRAKDMRDYEPIWRETLYWEKLGRKYNANPPPSAGGALIKLALSLLEKPKPTALEIASALTKLHHAREQIGHIKDPSKSEALLAPELLADLRARAKAWRGTTHISVIDENGMGASLSLTNGAGSGLIATGTGIHLNDMLGEPELIPKSLEAFPENTRLCSMMSPMIIASEDDFIVMGAAGSTRIPSALVQTLLPLLEGKNCTKAVETPRMHYEGELNFEDFFGDKVKEELLKSYPEAKAWEERAMFFGGVNIVRLHQGRLDGAGDPRRNSTALIAQ